MVIITWRKKKQSADLCLYDQSPLAFDPALRSPKIKGQSTSGILNITEIEFSLPRPIITISWKCQQTHNFWSSFAHRRTDGCRLSRNLAGGGFKWRSECFCPVHQQLLHVNQPHLLPSTCTRSLVKAKSLINAGEFKWGWQRRLRVKQGSENNARAEKRAAQTKWNRLGEKEQRSHLKVKRDTQTASGWVCWWRRKRKWVWVFSSDPFTRIFSSYSPAPRGR